jgi:hypothetical protein
MWLADSNDKGALMAPFLLQEVDFPTLICSMDPCHGDHSWPSDE